MQMGQGLLSSVVGDVTLYLGSLKRMLTTFHSSRALAFQLSNGLKSHGS